MTKLWAFIGSQTRWQEQAGAGIYSCQFDASTGIFTPVAVYSDIENPSFLSLSADGRYLYAVIEVDDYQGESSGAVAAFAIDANTAELRLLNIRASGGGHPCYLSLDKRGQAIFVANYSGGSVAVYPLQSDGSLAERSQLVQYQGSSIHPNQTTAHAHSVITSADNRYVFVQDLGTDSLHSYCWDPKNWQLIAQLPAIALDPGAGPRHLVFHPQQAIAYVVNELNSSVAVYAYQAALGRLTLKQTISTLPGGFYGQNSAADIHTTSNGRFLYASNRGHDSLAIFAIDPVSGELTAQGHQSSLGEHPRNFAISADDRLLVCANRNSDNVVSFYIEAQTGLLTPSKAINRYFNKPVCIAFSTLAVS